MEQNNCYNGGMVLIDSERSKPTGRHRQADILFRTEEELAAQNVLKNLVRPCVPGGDLFLL